MDEQHRKALVTLCRVCGSRCVRWPESLKKHGLDKLNYTDRLQKTYHININNDIQEIHPSYICTSCAAATVPSKVTHRPIIGWTEHNNNDCKACKLMSMTRSRRRIKPAKLASMRRKEREEEERKEDEIDIACNILLQASSQAKTHQKMHRVATKVVKELLNDEDMIELPTGGPKFVLKKMVIPRVPSTDASTRTIRARSKNISEHISQVSSTDANEEAALLQLSALLRGKSKEELKQLLNSEQLLQIRIPAGRELSFKAQMGWTWHEMRKLKRWLAAYKVKMVCENQSRKLKRELLGNYVQGEMLPFMFKENEEHITKLAPMVYIANLEEHIINTLNELDKLQLLEWDGIPEDEIWIKIGGDKGGGTTKFYYQIVNVARANSKFNTTAFCVYEADESIANLHTALDQYVPQITSLQQSEWRGKKISVWLVGDYEIERKLLGLQGAAATFPCILCHQTRHNLANSCPATPRDLATLQDDFLKVSQENFTSESKRANHSVSHKPFFDIPLDKVCPPSLHISLGIWGKFYQNLENDLTQLGQLIAEEKIKETQPSCSSNLDFQKHITKLKQILTKVHELEEQSNDLYEEATDLEFQLVGQSLMDGPPAPPSSQQMQDIQNLHQKSQQLHKEAEEIRNANRLELHENPIIRRLDEKLQSFKVRRQAYYSRTFNGNHVNKCLKAENYRSLLQEVVTVTSELTSNEDLHDMASRIQCDYMILFEHFASCHNLYSSSERFTPDQIDQLEGNITSLVEYYKSKFPRFSFTPKLHLLFQHVIPFIRLTGVGLGRMGEQGGEQLHHIFNILCRNLEGIKNVQNESPELRHLIAVMEEHLILVHPFSRPTPVQHRMEE